ncbi:HAD family hydrolase [Caldimonas tepidiphila]|uniref:HAD family hydrolase n=1 Tax=Caldimonas tepidiphila TaxID=2315841 RepID=UPI000E5B2A68|nr:HAD family hydrolase [Caldimonas tepidiphila]
MSRLLALTLDLDDTLWPVWPTIVRAERRLHDWLAEHAPATAQRHDTAAMRALRDRVGLEHPERQHDLTWLRMESLRRALSQAGDDPALAVPGFEVFFDERQRVELFDDVRPGLERLAARFPLVALTNGNADLGRIGLAPLFRGVVTARSFGVGKPDPRIFAAACELAGAPAGQVLHVGDDLLLDVEGALRAGVQAAWLKRPSIHPVPPAAPQGVHFVVEDLLALADAVGA